MVCKDGLERGFLIERIDMVSIICWKWGNRNHPKKGIRFTSDHVNILQAMIYRNTSVPHRFICITDNTEGLHKRIETLDIDFHFPNFKNLQGCYRRLKTFDPYTSRKLFGDRFISIDLDVVILNNIDHILSFKEDVRIWQDLYRRKSPYCGSLFGKKSGWDSEVWRKFSKAPDFRAAEAVKRGFVGTDQAFLSLCLYPNIPIWSEEDGIYNFSTRIRKQSRVLIRKDGGGLTWKPPISGELPENACIVFFNGKYDPSHSNLQEEYPWIKKNWKIG